MYSNFMTKAKAAGSGWSVWGKRAKGDKDNEKIKLWLNWASVDTKQLPKTERDC